MSRHIALHRLACVCLILLPTLLVAVGQLLPPFDLHSLIEDQRSIMLLSDTEEYTRHVPYEQVCLRQVYTPADFTTCLEAQDSLVTTHIETRYDPDLRQTEFGLRTAAAGVLLTSYDWAQRLDMAGLRAGGDVRWRGSKAEVAAAAQYWSAFRHTEGSVEFRYLLSHFALDTTVDVAHNPDIRWLAGEEAVMPWRNLVLAGGAHINDGGVVFGSARMQLTLHRNLLLQAGAVPELDAPPLADLFADSLLCWRLRLPTDSALDTWVSRNYFASAQAATGNWRVLMRWDGCRDGWIRKAVWDGGDWQWQRSSREGWRHTITTGLKWRELRLRCTVQPQDRHELEYRSRATVSTRLRLLPYTYLSLSGVVTDRLLLQNDDSSYATTGVGLEWTGAMHWEGGLHVENDWRTTLCTEEDRRLRISAYIRYWQGDSGR